MQLEEVIVTAQKRSERLQDVPIAMNALTAEQLEAYGVRELADVGAHSPGVFFKSLNVAQPQIFIRGIGTVQFDNSSEQPVGIFVDEVYIARHSAAVTDLFDVERVEVLKGPQGTLYGRNTIGGAINVATRQASQETDAQLSAELGNYDSINVRGAVGGRLGSDQLAGRLAVAVNERDGWTRNAVTGLRTNDDDSMGARVNLLATPTEALTLSFSADGARDRLSAFEQELKGTQNLGIAPPQVDLSPSQPYLSHSNVRGFQNRDIWGTSLRATVDLTQDVQLTSISAYRHHEFEGLRDLDVGPAPLLTTPERESGRQASQELRIASADPDDRTQWLFGLFYFDESSVRTEHWLVGGLFAPVAFFEGDYSWTYDGEVRSYAAFTQVSQRLGDKVKITAGLRYSNDEKEGTYETATTAAVSLPSFIAPAGFTSAVSESWDSLDPTVTIDYTPVEDVMLYASYKSGYKSGGFQHRPATVQVSQIPYDPEEVEAYEFGLKSQWLDRSLTVNVSAFHYDYTDLQQLDLIPNTIITFTSNVAAASIDGVELELTVRPTSALQLMLGYAYLDATYEDYLDSSGVQRKGNRLNRAPENALNAAIDYDLSLGNAGVLNFGLAYAWRDEVFFLQDNAPVNSDPSAGVLDARITFEPLGSRWSFGVWGKNLTEEVYCGNQIVNVPSSAAATCIVGAPRMYGAAVNWRY
jgi:iron complex outermembrane receptor protein